jgi:hypothetical protein
MSTPTSVKAALSHLDVNLSAKARLQPWYQPNFTIQRSVYSAANLAPHSLTERWSYTVPASRIAIIAHTHLAIMRYTAPTAASGARAWIEPAFIDLVYEITANVGVMNRGVMGQSSVLVAGEVCKSKTADDSTNGSYNYYTSASLMVFDT